jgi:protein ImuA
MTGHRCPAVIQQLRTRIAAIERMRPDEAGAGRPILALGQPAIDAALPWSGLPLGCLHEIVGQGIGGFAAASGFACTLLDRLGDSNGDDMEKTGVTVLWCLQTHEMREHGVLYAPGFFALGLDPAHTIITRGRRDVDILWAMEEGLRTPGVAAVVGETNDVDFTCSRRLQLAAEASGVTAFILRRGEDMPASAAVTRWRVMPMPSTDTKHTRWQLELRRCRGGTPNEWFVEWNDETSNFTVAPEFRYGTPEPQRAYA